MSTRSTPESGNAGMVDVSDVWLVLVVVVVVIVCEYYYENVASDEITRLESREMPVLCLYNNVIRQPVL